MTDNKKIMDIARMTKRGASIRVTIPKKVLKKLNFKDEDLIAFYESEDGRIYIDLLK